MRNGPMGETHFQTLDKFYSAIRTAPLVSRCGGPYPIDESIKGISLSEARTKLRAYDKDDTGPCSELDALVIQAYGEAYIRAHGNVIPPRPSLEEFLDEDLGLVDEDLCYELARRAAVALETRLGRDTCGVVYILGNLLASVGALMGVSRLDHFPVLRFATNVVLDGYLPVDVEHEGEEAKLLVW